MKRLLTLLVVAVLGFYVAWPAWSGYRLAAALNNRDASALESTVDFPSVRDSLRPAVTQEVGKGIDREMQSLGAAGQALGGTVRDQMLAKLVDQVLAVVVTPDNVIRIANDGGDIAASIQGVIADAAGQIGAVAGSAPGGASGDAASGGIGGVLGQVLGAAGSAGGNGDAAGIAGRVLGGLTKPGDGATSPAAAPPATSAKRNFGLGNIKGFGFAGPLGFNVALARDASQAKADATVSMSFTGGNWKLTRVVPNI